MWVRSLLAIGLLLFCTAAAPSLTPPRGGRAAPEVHPEPPSADAERLRRGHSGGEGDDGAVLRELGARGVRFASEPTPAMVSALKYLLGTPLPGPLHLQLFLDRSVFHDPIRNMRAAWRGRPSGELPSDPAALDAFFAAQSKQTVIAVGHVEGDRFSLDYGRGPQVSIEVMMAAAERHNVLLIPIGCRTSDADVTFGFDGNVSTRSVEEFLASLPESPNFEHLLASMARIGNVVVKSENLAHLEERLRAQFAVTLVDLKTGGTVTGFRVRGDWGETPSMPDLGLRVTEFLIACLALFASYTAFRIERFIRAWVGKGWFVQRRERVRLLPFVLKICAVVRFAFGVLSTVLLCGAMSFSAISVGISAHLAGLFAGSVLLPLWRHFFRS